VSAIEGKKPASGAKNEDAFAAASERMNKTIEAKKDYTDEVLRQLEENYSNFVKSQIAYHEFLVNAAEHKGDFQLYMHHKVMLETYQTTLANLRLSNRYTTV
jgi:lipopolysaccharide biosynthesis regulator YciM